MYDYELGKSDWLAFDLPHEGEATLAGDVAVRDLPTCVEDVRVGDLRPQAEASPLDAVVVVNDVGVVAGVVERDRIDADPDAAAGAVLREGPTTVRPSEDVDMLLHRMGHAHVGAVLVTRSDGVLLGAVVADA